MSPPVQKIREYWDVAKILGGKGVMHRIHLTALLVGVPLRKRLFGRKPVPLRLVYNGRTFVFNVRDGADIAVLKEVFVDGEYDMRLRDAPKKIIDIGSHVGASAAFFVCKYPGATITAYEPDPENFALLVENMKQFSNVMCTSAAVSSSSGEVSFFRNTESSISSSLMSRGGKEEKITVSSVSIRSILQEKDIDVIKFDIEGGEYDVFISAEATALPAALIGEVHYDLMKKSKEDFLRLFPAYTCEERPLGDRRAILILHREPK